MAYLYLLLDLILLGLSFRVYLGLLLGFIGLVGPKETFPRPSRGRGTHNGLRPIPTFYLALLLGFGPYFGLYYLSLYGLSILDDFVPRPIITHNMYKIIN